MSLYNFYSRHTNNIIFRMQLRFIKNISATFISTPLHYLNLIHFLFRTSSVLVFNFSLKNSTFNIFDIFYTVTLHCSIYFWTITSSEYICMPSRYGEQVTTSFEVRKRPVSTGHNQKHATIIL